MRSKHPAAEPARHILFYDGACCFCASIVQFALRHDRARLWRYSPLQSAFAQRELARYGVDAADLDQTHALQNYSGAGPQSDSSRIRERGSAYSASPGVARTKPGATERLRSGSDAGVLLWRTLSGWPRIVGALLTLTPRAIREPLYRLVARHRYRLFGRYDECQLPSPEQRALFILDDDAPLL